MLYIFPLKWNLTFSHPRLTGRALVTVTTWLFLLHLLFTQGSTHSLLRRVIIIIIIIIIILFRFREYSFIIQEFCHQSLL